MTREDLLARPLLVQLQTCKSHADILILLRTQIQDFEPSTSSGYVKMTSWLYPTINVLSFALSDHVVLVKFCSYDSTIYDL